MKEFTDAAGGKWPVVINGGTIKRALDLLKIDLGRPLDGKPPFINRFYTDVSLMVDVIYVTCLPECEQRGVKDTEFAALLGGDALYAASEAFMEELADFSQSLGRGESLRLAIGKQREVIDAQAGVLDELIGEIDVGPEMEAAKTKARAAIKAMKGKTPGRSSAHSRRSPAKTRTNTR